MNAMKKMDLKNFYINKDFYFLFQGQFISELGNALFLLATTWYIVNTAKVGSSGIYLAVLYACKLLPLIVIGPFSGVIADRLNRKLIIIFVDLINCLLFLSLYLFSIVHIKLLYFLFIATAANSTVSVVFEPAICSIIPNIVEKNYLISAFSMNKLGQQLSTIVAGVLTGFLYKKIGMSGFFLFNMLSFLFSAISSSFIKAPTSDKATTAKKNENGVIEEILLGFKYIKKDQAILIFLIFAIIITGLLTPITVILIPVLIKHYLYLGAKAYGIFSATSSLGAIIGMIIISHVSITPIKKLWKPFTIGLIGLSATSILYGIPVLPFILKRADTYVIFIILLCIGFIEKACNSFVGSTLRTIFSLRVPDEFRGRFFAILAMTWISTKPLGYFIVGVLLIHFKPYLLILGIGTTLLFNCIWLLRNRKIRELFQLL